MVFHRRRMQPPITSVKHIVQFANTVISNGARQVIAVVTAVAPPAQGATSDVPIGASVKALFLEYWIANTGAIDTDDQFIFTLEKAPSNSPGMTFTNMLNQMAYLNKNNVIYTSQGVISPQIDGATAIPVIRQWIKIPKGKQRMSIGDRWIVNCATVGTTLNMCGQTIFKEYT